MTLKQDVYKVTALSRRAMLSLRWIKAFFLHGKPLPDANSAMRSLPGWKQSFSFFWDSIWPCLTKVYCSGKHKALHQLGADYMANFGPGWDFSSVSWTNLLKTTFAITWRKFQPGLKFPARFLKPGWKFQPGQTGLKISCNQNDIFSPGWKARSPG